MTHFAADLLFETLWGLWAALCCCLMAGCELCFACNGLYFLQRRVSCSGLHDGHDQFGSRVCCVCRCVCGHPLEEVCFCLLTVLVLICERVGWSDQGAMSCLSILQLQDSRLSVLHASQHGMSSNAV